MNYEKRTLRVRFLITRLESRYPLTRQNRLATSQILTNWEQHPNRLTPKSDSGKYPHRHQGIDRFVKDSVTLVACCVQLTSANR